MKNGAVQARISPASPWTLGDPAGYQGTTLAHGGREDEDDATLERQLDECLEGLFGRSTEAHTPETASYMDTLAANSISAERLPVRPSQAAGVRHIAEWLRSAPGAGSEARRARLRTEHKELVQEHRSERLQAEELQVRLSAEMRELRDQCQEQGQIVGMLAQRLSDARSAVTAELRGAAATHSTLSSELLSEESQRRALEAARRGEEAEIAHRVEAAEQQLSTMSGVRASLEAQLHASARVQAELREHIAAERGGRSELKVAGERELVAWSEHNEKVCGELRSRLQSERAEVHSWRESTAREVSRLQAESCENSAEESCLRLQLESVRNLQTEVRSELQVEVQAWSREVDALRDQVHEADEEYLRSEDAIRRHILSEGACGAERQVLEEEVQERLGQAGSARGEIESMEQISQVWHTELQDLREQVHRYRTDQDVECLQQERDALILEVSREEQRHRHLREEIEVERKSWGFLCMRRRHVPNSPPDSPGRGHPAEPGPPPVPPPQHPPPKDQPRVSDSARWKAAELPRGHEVPQALAFHVGSVVVTMDSARMRKGEDMESVPLKELEPGQRCKVLELGSGRRLKVCTDTDTVGWISSTTPGGLRLIKLVPEDCSVVSFGERPAGVGSAESDQV